MADALQGLRRLTIVSDGGADAPGITSVTYVDAGSVSWLLGYANRADAAADRTRDGLEVVVVHHDGGPGGRGGALTFHLTSADRERLVAKANARRIA